MSDVALQVDTLCAGYGRLQIINDVSLSVPAGARVAILGRNGMGKSTLFGSIMGLTTYRSGRVAVQGHDVTRLKTTDRVEAGLGYVPQTRDMFMSLTVEENLRAGLRNRPRGDVAESYELFPRLAERRNAMSTTLSGGEQQMLSIARTLLGRPRVLLLDEPLEGLAPVICDELLAALGAMTGNGEITTVLIEQQLARALEFVQSVVVMERGSIAWQGSADALKRDAALVDRYLGVGVH